MADTESSAPGLRFGRYEVQGQLSAAPPWVTWSARDVETGRRVVLRVADTTRMAPAAVEALRQEAVLLTALRHPNVVAVRACGTDANALYRVEEPVRGLSLDRWPKESRRTWREICRAYLQAGSGLLAVHAVGLVAQPFNPAGVVVGPEERVVLCDLRSSLHPDDYASPEELEGRPRTARSDQFSFAVALVEALSGAYPFERRPSVSRGERSFQLVASLSRLPGGIGAALERALAMNPDERHASMRELLAALAGPVEATGYAQRLWWACAAASLLALNLGMVVGVLAREGSPFTSVSDVQKRLCNPALSSFEGIWDPATQDSLHIGLWRTNDVGTAESWALVRGTLTQWTNDWSALYERLCTTSALTPREALSLADTIACLHAERRALASFTSVLPSLGARRAIASLHGLPAPLSCGRTDITGLRWFEAVSQGRAHTSTTPTDAIDQPAALEKRAFAAWAEAEIELAARSFRRAAELHGRAGDLLSEAQARSNLAQVLVTLAAPDEAEHELRRALTTIEATPGSDALQANLRHALGTLLSLRSHGQEGMALLRSALGARQRTFGEDSAEVADTLRAIAVNEAMYERSTEAVATYRQALTMRQRVFGEAAPQVAQSHLELARALLLVGKAGEAEQHVESAEALTSRTIGRTARLVAHAHQVHAAARLALGDPAEALTLLEAAARIYESRGADALQLAEHAFVTARALAAIPGRRAEAEGRIREGRVRLDETGVEGELLRRQLDAWRAQNGGVE